MTPIELAAFQPEKSIGEIYEDAFNAKIADKPDFYKDKDLRADIVAEMAKPVHLPWFKQAYHKYAKGKRFADQIPGREKYAPLTLTTRNQPYKLSQLTHSTTADPNRLLTHKMRQTGKALADVHYYIPRNREEYLQKHPEARVPPKTQAAASANLAITPLEPPESSLPPISPSPVSQSSIPASQPPPPSSQRKPMSDDMFADDDDDDDVMELQMLVSMLAGVGIKEKIKI